MANVKRGAAPNAKGAVPSPESRDLLLLTPGPTILPPEVRRALADPMPHHRGPRFRTMLRDCLAGLREMLHTEDGVALFACSGRGGLEASLVDAFAPGGAVGALDAARGLNALEETLASLGAPCPAGAWHAAIDRKGG